MDPLPVTLIVKAPNQAEYEDHTVKCELSWTIRKLKGHLAEVYPCKPEEQKLIYSGQLLQDAVVLKDVLRQYDGQETHTVHLVYTPKQMRNASTSAMESNKNSSPSTTTTGNNSMTGGDSASSAAASGGDNTSTTAASNGLRRRNVGSSPSAATATVAGAPLNLQASALYSQPFPAATALTTPNNLSASDQIASYQQWYQQQYANYINQYMAYMASVQQQAPVQMPWTVPTFVPQFVAQAGAQPATPSATASAAATAAPAQGANDANLAAGDVQEQQQQPRFPRLVHEPELPERDWLDHLYTFCRITFLLLMIYFYSSALRFAVVMCAICALFLYRNRVVLFRPGIADLPLPPQAAAAPPVAAAQAPAEPGAEGVGEEVPLLGRDERRPDNNNNNLDVANRNAEATNANQEQNSPTTVLSFLRTFVTSFIYSLLPEPAMGP